MSPNTKISLKTERSQALNRTHNLPTARLIDSLIFITMKAHQKNDTTLISCYNVASNRALYMNIFKADTDML